MPIAEIETPYRPRPADSASKLNTWRDGILDEAREIVLHSPTMIEFRKVLFSKVVPNVKRLGLLSPWLRERFEQDLDILKFEHEEPSA
jgi:hypothetical protein